MIVIVDFGSQTTHLISRRVAEMGVKSVIVEPEKAIEEIEKLQPKGIILSGGPGSVYNPKDPTVDKIIFQLNIPILGICYGLQLMTHLLGGQVKSGKIREFGPAFVQLTKKRGHGNLSMLFNDLPRRFRVWMSHSDEAVKLPPGFCYIASSENIPAAAIADEKRKMYGVQFHPEVKHTQYGQQILNNFMKEICGLKLKKKDISINQLIEEIKNTVGKNKVIGAVSGGVDSTVAATLVAKAIGQQFFPIYVENGLMRVGTDKEIKKIFKEQLGITPVTIDARAKFLRKLKGVTDPEKKRKIIGGLYIELFEKAAKKVRAKYLLQGTIYSDVIESQGSKHASKIKSHHNVGGLPEKLGLKLLEPLRLFYKDEVRVIGKKLHLPDDIVYKQPFPGPGNAIRIIGVVTDERLRKHQQVDSILLSELKKAGWLDKVFQSFPVLTGTDSTAVKGDARSYGEVIALRIYQSDDIMTAGWARIPYDILQKLATRIVNEVPDVSRVVYDITTKPPATMEWE